jgi:signal transduction histidine kinase
VTPRRTRLSGVTALAAAVLVLLPALAWLQYSWLDQIADADRERRARTLHTTATQLAQDLDAEIGRAVFALQLDASIVEQRNWPAFAQKYQVWAASAASPRIVKAIYFVEAPEDGPGAPDDLPLLRTWNAQTHTFDETAWTEDLAALRTRFVRENVAVFDLPGTPAARAGDSSGPRMPMHRMFLPPAPTGDDQSIVMPIVRVASAPATAANPTPASEVTLLGFNIIRLDIGALGTDVLPSLVRKHLYDGEGRTDYVAAVVARETPAEVIFESQPGGARIAGDNPDATASLLGPRMGQFLFMARAPEGRRAVTIPPPLSPAARGADPSGAGDLVVNVIEAKRKDGDATVVQRAAFAGEGQWRLVIKHRAGSLEAAVSAARTRNFALSSGILMLLATAIGLIVVSARRADRLARQQIEFVAAVSHELRTPVSVIGAAAGNLADGVVEEPRRVRTYGATIQTEARRLAETVERVLQLAGIATGRTAASPAALPVAALVDDAVAATRPESEAAGTVVEVHIADELRQTRHDPGGVAHVMGDAAALKSAIQNLTSNAIKYGGDGRWVRVSALALSETATRIMVEDRGLGIPAEDRKHIFEPFYRGREALARQLQGTGLGLHLVQRIVEAHGGTVGVHSEPGRGSTFTIDLPGMRVRPGVEGAIHDVVTVKPRSFVRRLARLPRFRPF